MKNILITGATGEIGHGLIKKLSLEETQKIVALDIVEPKEENEKDNCEFVKGDILDRDLLENLFTKYKFDVVFHLAAMLSTSSEKDPVRAHHVNTDGSINLLSIAERFSRENKSKVTFIFPSSIAIYGLPDVETGRSVGKIKETEWNKPATMYGCNKLYVELLGNYYSRYFQKDGVTNEGNLLFRSVRFPGIISADTLPTGGTSDYGPEMLHAAAAGKDYECFVRKDTTIPFMVMPDAVKALLMLANAPVQLIKQPVYNVGSFSISAEEIAEIAKRHFGEINITYKPNARRQAIVDSWPIDVDDSAAQTDWGWQPDYNKEKAFNNYLIPGVKNVVSKAK